MIMRVWHGWTTPEKADIYEPLLIHEIFIGIVDRNLKGFRGIKLLRRVLGNEVEFVTLMEFDDLEAVKSFAGEDLEQAVVPVKARALLSHFDHRSEHYELVAELPGEILTYNCITKPANLKFIGYFNLNHVPSSAVGGIIYLDAVK